MFPPLSPPRVRWLAPRRLSHVIDAKNNIGNVRLSICGLESGGGGGGGVGRKRGPPSKRIVVVWLARAARQPRANQRLRTYARRRLVSLPSGNSTRVAGNC